MEQEEEKLNGVSSVSDEQVVGLMISALKSASKSTKVGLETLRIQMRLTEGLSSTECFSLNKSQMVDKLSWGKILGVKAIAFKGKIVRGITESLLKLATENRIERKELNVRIYAIDSNATPNFYLYNGRKAVKQIELKELL
jgi:hypothetical protein